MIKSVMAAGVALAMISGAAHAQERPRSPVEVAQAFERHFNASDMQGLETLYGEGSLFIPAPGVPLSEPDQIRGALTQFMASGVPIRLTIRHVYQADDTALIIFDWVMKGAARDGTPVDMTGTGADVVRRQADGAWAYVIDNPFGVAKPAQ